VNDDDNLHVESGVYEKRKLLLMDLGCWVQERTKIILEIF
jgi:hypothetical protein